MSDSTVKVGLMIAAAGLAQYLLLRTLRTFVLRASPKSDGRLEAISMSSFIFFLLGVVSVILGLITAAIR